MFKPKSEKNHDLKLTFTEIMGEMELILSYPQDARKHQVITFVEANPKTLRWDHY